MVPIPPHFAQLVIPNVMGLVIHQPRVNKEGISPQAEAFCRQLVGCYRMSLFDRYVTVNSATLLKSIPPPSPPSPSQQRYVDCSSQSLYVRYYVLGACRLGVVKAPDTLRNVPSHAIEDASDNEGSGVDSPSPVAPQADVALSRLPDVRNIPIAGQESSEVHRYAVQTVLDEARKMVRPVRTLPCPLTTLVVIPFVWWLGCQV